MEDLQQRFQDAVQQFWTGRANAQRKQVEGGRIDAGNRGAVTSGTHMGPLEVLVVDLLMEAGLQQLDIKVRSHKQQTLPRNTKTVARTGLELPGYYRPAKQWDLLVISGGRLISAIEIKSQVGSYGNNYNNRVEEAIGNATDIWTAFREGRIGTHRPFLGYFFLLEDEPDVHRPVNVRQPYFPIDPIFDQASYSERYEVLCKRLILERLYDAACLTLTTNSDPTRVSFPNSELSFYEFAAKLQGHARGIAQILNRQ